MNATSLTLAGRYKIHGNIRFLSHQETMRVIARAIIRSGIEPAYSQGYNPHLKLSLPLPRNVGLASDDELFCAEIEASCRQQSGNFSFADSIAEQLPEGLELISVEIIKKPVTYQPVEVEYLVKVNLSEKQGQFFAKIQKINEQIQAGSEILIERTVNREGDVKTIDVGKFLKSFEIVQQGARVFCRVLPTGTIRPDEILRLLNMDSYEVSRTYPKTSKNAIYGLENTNNEGFGMACSSIVRKKVIWQTN